MPNLNDVKLSYQKKILIAISPAMLNVLDELVKTECRASRSELIREALRRYIKHAPGNKGVVINNATDE